MPPPEHIEKSTVNPTIDNHRFCLPLWTRSPPRPTDTIYTFYMFYTAKAIPYRLGGTPRLTARVI